jgi:hypothetical protein
VQKYIRPVGGAAAIAILTAVAMTGAPQAAAPQDQPATPEKKVKDQAEYDISDSATKDVLSKNGSKAIEDLTTWKQKYPDSDYKADRETMFVQAYQLNKQYDKVLEKTNELMGQNLDAMFPDPKTGPKLVVQVLFTAVTAFLQIQDPTPEQLVIADKAAHAILDYKRKPEGVDDTAWAEARKTLNDAANATIQRIALVPGMQAAAKKDCPAAEAAWTKALGAYPENTWVSYQLASAYNCEQKPFQALYEYMRAAAVDPTLGKSTDGAKVSTFVKNTYTKLHGSDEGYDQLLATAKSSPLPPPDFKIVTKDELDAAATEKFAKDNPELAMWTNIRGSLATQGDAFFQNMKGAELPQFIGVIVDAKPACHSKSLTVYVPLPNNTAKTPEITIKFEKALSGKPEIGSTIKFVGVGDAFTATPFMLTLTEETDKVQDLKLTPCAAPATTKKGVKK